MLIVFCDKSNDDDKFINEIPLNDLTNYNIFNSNLFYLLNRASLPFTFPTIYANGLEETEQ